MKRPNVTPPRGVAMVGTGIALPEQAVTNADLAERVDTSDEWIAQRTGIRQRYLADESTGVFELGTAALRQAIDAGGLQASDLDLLLCATITPEMCCPSTAARIINEIGAVPAGAMDVSAACSGFVYCMNMADSLIRTGMYRTIGVIGAETLSRITDWDDRRTCVLFGDGAGAAVLTASDDPDQGSVYHTMHSNGDGGRMLYCPKSERDIPEKDTIFTGKFNTLQMNGREVYKFAVSTLVETIESTLTACDCAPDEVKLVIPHQMNSRIIESAIERMGMSPDQVHLNIDRYANTSAASVPICLHEAVDNGLVGKGDLVLLVALGGGLTWAANLWRL